MARLTATRGAGNAAARGMSADLDEGEATTWMLAKYLRLGLPVGDPAGLEAPARLATRMVQVQDRRRRNMREGDTLDSA